MHETLRKHHEHQLANHWVESALRKGLMFFFTIPDRR
jgi:hypothetical protein